MAAIYLIPCVLAENAIETIPSYIMDAVKKCTVIFAENERTARRFLKSIDKSVVIDDFEWFAIHKAEEEQKNNFRQKIKEEKKQKGCLSVRLDCGYRRAAKVTNTNGLAL